MRSEQEMLELILGTAKNDDRIRAVILNGSRVNPNAPRDFFQDFDVIYLVTQTEPFRENLDWIKRFGEIMILQMPDTMGEHPSPTNGRFAYLMQFADGNRIDLTVFPVAQRHTLEPDSLTVVLLDKDGLMAPVAPPNDSGYLPKPPTAKAFADCCNEFWWMCPYVAKGLWREEMTYAKYNLDHYVREQLMQMLTWQVGVKTQFQRSPGKLGKYLKHYLQPELWALLEKTYADADDAHTWDALDAMGRLFRITAHQVAEHFGFEYPLGDDERVSVHLKHVRALPKDAPEMY